MYLYQFKSGRSIAWYEAKCREIRPRWDAARDETAPNETYESFTYLFIVH
jgi:hypothetical protein